MWIMSTRFQKRWGFLKFLECKMVILGTKFGCNQFSSHIHHQDCNLNQNQMNQYHHLSC